VFAVAPVCKAGQQKVHGVARQEAVKILCELDANPQDGIHFSWRFNNTAEIIDIPASHFTTDRARSVASYTPMTELDYGTLLCRGRNELGVQKAPCVFHIIPAGMLAVKITHTNSLTHSLHGAPLLEKLIVTQLIKKYPAFFMEPEGSLPCSQKPAIGPYHEPAESSSPHQSLNP
jgi:hypothetical protein